MSATPPDPWHFLRDVTAARIALGRTGGSLPTRELLDFSLAHARAQDAVHVPFRAEAVVDALAATGLDSLVVSSATGNRETYLRRPDLGRQLDAASRQALQSLPRAAPIDLVAIVSDGLSAPAAELHAAPLLSQLVPQLVADGWQIAPVIIVRHGRVAIEDEIGELVEARLALILLGERPGLGSPDSLGAYFVYEPRIGRTDAERNCVSNIRPDGMPVDAAAETLHHLLTQARQRRLSGVALKDERATLPVHAAEPRLRLRAPL
jgi:ethanolamine ammonia-lyase small subunit